MSTLITGAAVLRGSRILTKERQEERLRDIAELVAAELDPDELARIQNPDQMDESYFRLINKRLVAITESSNRPRLKGIKYVYIVRKVKGKPMDRYSSYAVVVDGTAPTEEGFLAPGQIMPTSDSTDALHRVWEAKQFVIDRHFVKDQWGTWLSGYLPLEKRDGSFEAVLGIDIDAESINEERLHILMHLMRGFGVGLVLILPGVVLFGRRLARPLQQIEHRHQALSSLDLEGPEMNSPIEAQWIQEIHAINRSLQKMQGALGAFSRYVPVDLVRRLVIGDGSMCLDGETRELAIMFSDIVGFTSLSENLTPKETLSLLNEYFEIFDRTSKETNGTLDKYIGDAAMVFWGAPEPVPNPALQCLEAALRCDREIQMLNKTWHLKGFKVTFETCFGLDFGEVVVGNIGSNDRVNYTIVGARVNLCSRLEHQNRVYGTRVLATRSFIDSLGPHKNNYTIVKVDVCRLRGFHQSVEVFEIRGHYTQSSPEERHFADVVEKIWSRPRGLDATKDIELLDSLPNRYQQIPYIRQLRNCRTPPHSSVNIRDSGKASERD
ncbi:adenylate/guanylate cyclase domain-containing protein [Cyanobium sp. CH-040]|uniref:adenylate/guanylate cyclase domain-containing protein n=1 Tax=Cyanobium sp. CH-040 TaxID=2823708 RepID=UPI0020CD3807|nr:adenylate/guanylate cyclase domain-containing protein [Cyanobium sp. CH-040]MCP9928610.1 adenylate/guanylate cyclase domain-containing protein [Cyanobium sp. CH-040]